MDFFWDVVIRVLGMGAGVAFFAWLLAYNPRDRQSRAAAKREKSAR